MNIASYTLGCKLNKFESEALVSRFRDQGFFVADWQESADLYIVNTCTVTSKSEQKARRIIRKISRDNPFSAVIVTGCYAQLDPQEIQKLGENVHVVSQEEKSTISALAEYLQVHGFSGGNVNQIVSGFFSKKANPQCGDVFAFDTNDLRHSSRAYLKIQDGCDNRCNYCRIPLARGGSVSLDYSVILQRIDSVLEAGYHEIILTGINISAYNFQGVDFADLLAMMADKYCHSDLQIRLSSIEPDSFSDKLYKVLEADIFCPHFHIAVQSASSKVLSEMGRKYDAPVLPEIVQRLREIKRDPFLAADIIVGYQGESDLDFEETFLALKKMDFAHLHVFPFSPREGTVDEHPRNPIPERIRDERAQQLRELSSSSYHNYLLRNNLRELYFIAEKSLDKSGDWVVVSDNYIKSICAQPLVRGLRYRGLFEIDNDGHHYVKIVK
ncbi:MAG: tRNA (N(6)-L-threonylcarbamoyladenosine(37)-C(2))-methylthiotransferase MtaB [Spirochaetales bacterium]|nr:tRNA (N(6)-L-threonylcarbamoyladenosine(37)-C(2))-methylthiotransferase MtaB [Spirochaetales bacterium]